MDLLSAVRITSLHVFMDMVHFKFRDVLCNKVFWSCGVSTLNIFQTVQLNTETKWRRKETVFERINLP